MKSKTTYEDFTGILIKKRKLLFSLGCWLLTLQNEKKTIKVKIGYADDLIIGQKFKIGHEGRQIIGFRPLSYAPYSKAMNKKNYSCKLLNKTVSQLECADVQSVSRKPEECETIEFDLETANQICPSCPFNQGR